MTYQLRKIALWCLPIRTSSTWWKSEKDASIQKTFKINIHQSIFETDADKSFNRTSFKVF